VVTNTPSCLPANRPAAIPSGTGESAAAQLARLEALPRKEEVPPLEARVAEAKANLEDKEKLFERTRRGTRQPDRLVIASRETSGFHGDL